jgi:hypothetical protein
MKRIISNQFISFKIYLSLILISVINFSCNILDIDKIPAVNERGTTYKITVIDNSGYMKALFGFNLVRNAEIMLKSNMQGTEYNLVTDSNGVANISGIISDNYLVTVNRWMLPDEMKIITGASRGDMKLTNTNTRNIKISPGVNIVIPLESSIRNSPIVISEIYGSGPQGSGLYYHDKFVEFFNQSDSVMYLDGLLVIEEFANYSLGIRYASDPDFIHSKNIWKFPGSGKEYPIQPGQFIVCAEDAIDHRFNAPNSIDLSHADFEFYKDDAPDVDNPNVPNMIRVYEPYGNDWLIGGEGDGLVISNCPADSIIPSGDQFLIPYKTVLDGVEYLKDPTRLDLKILNSVIDAGATGGIQFYTGKSMERKAASTSPRLILKDDNNSSVDFDILQHPTPDKYH